MDAFLRCLRVAVGGCDHSRQGALWWVRRELPQTAGPLLVRYGLGFSQTVEQYGYCSFEPCIDWARLKFLPTISELVLFGTGTLQQRYFKTLEAMLGIFLTLAVVLTQVLSGFGNILRKMLLRIRLCHDFAILPTADEA